MTTTDKMVKEYLNFLKNIDLFYIDNLNKVFEDYEKEMKSILEISIVYFNSKEDMKVSMTSCTCEYFIEHLKGIKK